jgi:hypothetical protein
LQQVEYSLFNQDFERLSSGVGKCVKTFFVLLEETKSLITTPSTDFLRRQLTRQLHLR